MVSRGGIGVDNAGNGGKCQEDHQAQANADNQTQRARAQDGDHAIADTKAQDGTPHAQNKTDQTSDCAHPDRANAHQQQIIANDLRHPLGPIDQVDIFDDHGGQDEEGRFRPQNLQKTGRPTDQTRGEFLHPDACCDWPRSSTR